MESDVLLSQIDLFRSLASLIGASLPRNAAPDSDNRLSNWLGIDSADRPWILEQSGTLSIRTRSWKYIAPYDGPKMVPWGVKIETGYLAEPQLYRIDEGDEQNNVAESNPQTVIEMQSLINAIRDRKEGL